MRKNFFSPFLLAIGMLVFHLAIWIWTAAERGVSFASILNHWDSSWYNAIIVEGYRAKTWAFYPLYPFSVRLLAWLVPGGFPIAFLGSCFSAVLFFLTLRLLAKTPALAPKTIWGWVFFIFSPASYIFHSHHTESLFLFLSVLAWRRAFERSASATGTGFFAGLSALTKMQGFFVMLGVVLVGGAEQKPSQVVQHMIKISVVALATASLFPLYQYMLTGDPFLSLAAQANWAHTQGLWQALSTLWFANPWQNMRVGSLIHHGFYLLLLLAVPAVLRFSLGLGLTMLCSVAVMLFQGELINSLRFGAVLFPLLFFLGDRMGRSRPLLLSLFVLLLVLLNFAVTRSYALGRWAY